MKVLQVLPELQSGGVERGTLELGDHLVRTGHESLVVSHGGKLVNDLEQAGSRHIAMAVHRKSPLSLLVVRRFRELLKRERPDILHLRSRLPAWIAWLAWRRLPIRIRPRLVTTVHGFYSVNAYSRIMTCGERVVCVSNSIRDYVTQNYPETPQQRLTVIHRGIDPAEYFEGFSAEETWKREWYRAFPQTLGRRLLVIAGRLTSLKGQMDFIDLFHELNQREKNLHGLIVGGAHPKRLAYAASLREKVAQLGLEKAITFTDSRDDLREIFSLARLVFSLSRKPESFGRTVLEPLALGIPVVGFSDGGVGEIMREMFPEGIVERHDASSVLDKTLTLLANPLKPQRKNPFLLERMLAETVALYESMLRMPHQL
jgi:glycosyltransferase involved in cell wall biosynthesis